MQKQMIRFLDICENSGHVDNSGTVQAYKILFTRCQCG